MFITFFILNEYLLQSCFQYENFFCGYKIENKRGKKNRNIFLLFLKIKLN